jgi:ligand-binding SRPBCC domain-containing protein
MPLIELTTAIAAPVERVFDLSRSIDLHMDSTAGTGERAVAGVTSGLIGMGQEVTWRARHFGVWQTLTVRITAFEPPFHFADTMLRGAFRRMEHHHYFEPIAPATGGGTLMRDVFDYASPLGVLGRIADVLFLERYMRSFLMERNRVIRAAAESGGWDRYVGSGGQDRHLDRRVLVLDHPPFAAPLPENQRQ